MVSKNDHEFHYESTGQLQGASGLGSTFHVFQVGWLLADSCCLGQLEPLGSGPPVSSSRRLAPGTFAGQWQKSSTRPAQLYEHFSNLCLNHSASIPVATLSHIIGSRVPLGVDCSGNGRVKKLRLSKWSIDHAYHQCSFSQKMSGKIPFLSPKELK